MPRAARKKSESGIYHVMLRGINRETIFLENEDYEKYLHCLSECKAISGFTLYAYCLMGNHIHLLLKEGREPLAQVFKRIGSRYVFWYNWKYQRSGHLFQDRYKSEPVEDDAYFQTVLRYIYRNPVKANLCKTPGDYKWSSYRTLGQEQAIADNDSLAELMPITELRAYAETDADDEVLDLKPDLRFTDDASAQLVRQEFGIENPLEIQYLPPERQNIILKKLHMRGSSIRQLARLTGISKGKLERQLRNKDE
jgi:REP element-mobilizing transposase RayT